MCSDWSRRAFLSSGCTGFAALVSGCTLPTNSWVEKAEQESWSTHQSLPERPTEFTKNSVSSYVAKHAQISTANEYLVKDATNVQVTTVASLARQSGDAYFLVVWLTGSVDFVNGASPRFGGTLFYYVTQHQTVRATHTKVRNIEPDTTSDKRGFEISNFDSQERTMSIQVSDTGTTVFDDSIILPVEGGKSVSLVNGSGTFDVRVSVADVSRTFRWQVTENPRWEGLWIQVVPDGTLHACGTTEAKCRGQYPPPNEVPPP